MKTVTSADAQNRFGELLDVALREPVSITRRGRTVAFMISPEDLKDLIDARPQRQEAVAAYDAYARKLAEQANPATQSLSDEDATRLVHELR